MYQQLAVCIVVFFTILKYFGSPRGVVQKEFLAEDIKMEHWEIISSTLQGLRETKATDTREQRLVKLNHAIKIIKAQYQKVLDTLEKELVSY
jgi:hypothetical protein